ncbi:cyclic lactone autoinducer peptide [Anaerosacchariphilus polymeriproducens]|uniref:Cyclic lactone autoinducer peptide n=1 Tax=Anaerosacchariphilus polymeriproducens TaxID=1812858 RepID=A0A371AY09_9FIRM|nr:cyclic lactone autoinducer peptide [Anaerosacchariphilus polymeriproducens]RDU24465.1 cyclic lactone autoinducer peptide [Anaerosacchariphilus polymeriproducens]
MQKNFKEKVGHAIVSISKFMASANVNSTCVMTSHQEKIPETVKKLRKF